VGKPEGKSPLGKTRLRWEDDIKAGLREIGYGVRTGFIWLRIGASGTFLLTK
jgi:hypothetical protein